jgi:2-methylisocitrate lyase-like PEP mutase family enzyme
MTMDLTPQRQRAEAFRKMHDRSRILILPNAWDVASAKIFEAAGFRAVATTSSGIANSLGYPDGEAVPLDEMLPIIKRMANGLKIPLSADMESGYARDIEDLKTNIRAAIEAGAIGINFEDRSHNGPQPLHPIEMAVERVRAVRAAADSAGIPIVINARTDVYLAGIGEMSSRFEHTVRRANAYRAAGADCLFVPGVTDAETIGKLAAAIDGPMNVLAVSGTPSAPELEKLGVARVSIGGGPARAALTTVRRIARELLDSGTYSLFTSPETLSTPEANRLMSRTR